MSICSRFSAKVRFHRMSSEAYAFLTSVSYCTRPSTKKGMAMPSRATVYIWMPNGLAKFLGAGHGSLEITTDANVQYYITWMGSNFSSAGPGTSLVGFTTQYSSTGPVANPRAYNVPTAYNARTKKYTGAFSYAEDCTFNADRMGAVDSAPANYILPIECRVPFARRPSENLWGLDVDAIERWWVNMMTTLLPGSQERVYKALSKKYNCDGKVVEALLQGGLDAYAKPPRNLVFQGADTLQAWVKKAAAKIIELNQQRRDLLSDILKQDGLQVIVDFPSLDKWKEMSRLGVLARRRDQIANIDELIPQYHTAKLNNDRPQMRAVLGQIQTQIFDHLANKPDSDRRAAVLKLAKGLFREMDQESL